MKLTTQFFTMFGLLLGLFCSTSSIAQVECEIDACFWEVLPPYPGSHVILVSDSMASNINGVSLEVGDYIGVFYADENGVLHCSDYEQWLGEAVGLFAQADDSFTSNKDGFQFNELLNIVIWKNNQGAQIVVEPIMASPSIVISAEDKFTIDGLSLIESIDYQGSGTTTAQLSVLLEGVYLGAHQMNTLLNPFIPMEQPYNGAPWLYNGTETLTEKPANMVDWVLVQAMEGTPDLVESNLTPIETKAGILLDNGKIIGVDNDRGISFNQLEWGQDYYFLVRHRNHLDILSATPSTAQHNVCYDFTSNVTQAFGNFQQKESGDGFSMMLGGDLVSDGIIQVSDYDAWYSIPAAVNVYGQTDANLDGFIQVSDYDEWFKNKARVGIPDIQF